MDVTLEINGRDFSSRLSTYRVEQEITYSNVLTTMDGTEHYGKTMIRDTVRFSLLPFDDGTAAEDCATLTKSELEVNYTVPQAGGSLKQNIAMKLQSNLNAAFGLRSVNGKRYYKGSEIVLRAINVE